MGFGSAKNFRGCFAAVFGKKAKQQQQRCAPAEKSVINMI
jgi:hypothetical protein